jgi:hypothetical protein
MPVMPKKKSNVNNVRGPVGFAKIKDKATAKQAAAEWVNNTSSGKPKSDARVFDALMKKAGFPDTKNPFLKSKTVNKLYRPMGMK